MAFSLEDRCLFRAAMILFGLSVLAFIALEMVKLLTGYLQMRANLTTVQQQLDGMQKALRRMTNSMTRLEDVIYLNLEEHDADVDDEEEEIVEVVDKNDVQVKKELQFERLIDSGTDVTSFEVLATVSDPPERFPVVKTESM